MTKTEQTPKIYQLKISLNYTKHEIWCRFHVRSDISLVKLHNVIQEVMGSQNYHLYHFEICDVEYAGPWGVISSLHGRSKELPQGRLRWNRWLS